MRTTFGVITALTLIGLAGCARPQSNFSQYPGFDAYFAEHPRRTTAADADQRLLLQRHRPHYFLPAGHPGLIGFYQDYIAHGTLRNGRGERQAQPVTRASLNRLRSDPAAVFVHEPDEAQSPAPVVLARIDSARFALGSHGSRQLTLLTYHAVFRHSGLAAGLSAWQEVLAALFADINDWHQLDHYTAASLLLDEREQPVALMLQQHNHQRTWVYGVDLPLPADGRPALDVAIRSNELYPHTQSRRSHRVVRFPTPEAMLYLMEMGEPPRYAAFDMTEPANEIEYRLDFLPPDDAFYSFAGYLGARRRLPGRDGPPGADFNTWPSIKSWPLQVLAGYWRVGDAGDAQRLRDSYARSGDPADFARAQAQPFGDALAVRSPP